jgi:hypothetical protein
VQGMLDFDFICKRKQPSVAGIIYTFGGQFVSKMCVPSKYPTFCNCTTDGIQVLGNQRDSAARLPDGREGRGQAQRR